MHHYVRGETSFTNLVYCFIQAEVKSIVPNVQTKYIRYLFMTENKKLSLIKNWHLKSSESNS